MQAASAAIRVEDVATPACVARSSSLSVGFAPAASRIDVLREEWSGLAQRASEANAFAEPWFVAASVRHLAQVEIRLAEVRDGSDLIGIQPLVVEQGYGRVPVRFVQNWRHHHHFFGAPLVAAGRERDFWRTLLGGLDAATWAPGFLHIRDLAEQGPLHLALEAVAGEMGRAAHIAYREVRALLRTDLNPDDYYSQAVRKKKRKELARLRNRLAEEGELATRFFAPGDDLAAWCDAFLRLEAAGWKGREGSALGSAPATEAFFRDSLAGAEAAGRLQIIALELDRTPIAMLVNFVSAPGSFSFKTAFDESYARFSPGVLIQRENLAILERDEIDWMDSCAAENHPMIDSFWTERRTLVRVTVPLSGRRRRLSHFAARRLEDLAAATRGRRAPKAAGDSE
jgi:CelD/BcsL family acetyltransferase involved in cellulose biosynthesis